MARWRNWGGTYSSRPARTVLPGSEDEVAEAVKSAAAAGLRVKVPGTGHSFTDIARTDGVMVRLGGYDRVLSIDHNAKTVTVEAGITLSRLSEELAEAGLALPNLGDVTYQTVAGAISTATHGTGIKLGNLSTQVAAMTIVVADGSVLSCSEEENADLFSCAKVGLGALGVISTVTLQCVPAFNLEGFQERVRLDACLAHLDEEVEANEHFEFFWFPHTDWVQTKRNNKTEKPPRPKGKFESFLDQIVIENGMFGLMCRLGKARPASIPNLNRRVVAGIGKSSRVDQSHKIFATPRLVRFVEMEYAVPREHAADAVREVRSMIEREGLLISFPIEVRFVAPDEIPLSPSFGRETCYIAVHVYKGMSFERYFGGVESIMSELGGRPHWGKMHFQTHETLAPRYPRWEDFQAARRLVDPEGVFANDYTDRVLGPA